MAISGPDTAGLADSLPVPAINKAAGVLETTLKRRLFPIRCAVQLTARCTRVRRQSDGSICSRSLCLEPRHAFNRQCCPAVWALQRSASQQGHRHLLCTMYHQVRCCC